jgi:hypothetical protein
MFHDGIDFEKGYLLSKKYTWAATKRGKREGNRHLPNP